MKKPKAVKSFSIKSLSLSSVSWRLLMFCFSSQICSKIQNFYPDLLLNSHIASTHATHPVPNIQLEMNHDVRCQEKTLYIIQVHKNTVDRIDTVWEQLMTGRRTVCRRVTQEGSSYKTAPLYLKHCSNLWWNKLRRCAVKMIKQYQTIPCYFTITWQTNFLRSCYNARFISCYKSNSPWWLHQPGPGIVKLESFDAKARSILLKLNLIIYDGSSVVLRMISDVFGFSIES